MKPTQFEDKYQHQNTKIKQWKKPIKETHPKWQKEEAKYNDYGSMIDKKPKKREWTLEDQALEDILWAS